MRKNGHFWGWIAAACLVPAATSSYAEQRLYSLDIPDAQAAHFEVPIGLEHAGKLTVHADWEGNRTLAFRINEMPVVEAGITLPESVRPWALLGWKGDLVKLVAYSCDADGGAEEAV